MTTEKELLSAFVDGEMSHEELEQLLMLSSQDQQFNARLMQYQHTSDLLKGYTQSLKPVDMTGRIKSIIDAEPAYVAAADASLNSSVLALPDWIWKQALGLLAAGSIGAVLMMNVMTPNQSASPMQFVQNEEVGASPTTTAVTLAESAPSNRWTVGEDEVQDRLNNYLVDHNEYGGPAGVFSYARVVSYGEE